MTLAPAVFSPDRTYRYVLRRSVGLGTGTCLFCLLNPSDGNEMRDDPTIRRCMGFARDWGYAALAIVNAFGLASPEPRALYEAHRKGIDPIGPDNDRYILEETSRADIVVVGWGNHGAFLDRGRDVIQLLSEAEIIPWCLGWTAEVHPRHPLYVPKSVQPKPFTEAV